MLNINAMTNAQLVNLYNKVSEQPLPTKKFRDQKTAVERVSSILTDKELVVLGTVEDYRIESKLADHGEACNPNHPDDEVDTLEMEASTSDETILERCEEQVEAEASESPESTEMEASNDTPVENEAATETEQEGPDVAIEVTAEQAQALDEAAAAKVIKRRAGTKLEQLVQMLSDPKGVTNEEAKVEFGWPAISIKTMATKMGYELQMRKEGREKRYFLASVELPPLPEVEATAVTPKAKKGKVTLTQEEYDDLVARAGNARIEASESVETNEVKATAGIEVETTEDSPITGDTHEMEHYDNANDNA